MLKVEDNFIYLTKGDTAYLTIELEDDDEFQVFEFKKLHVTQWEGSAINQKNMISVSLRFFYYDVAA